jgi:hypothetical protein
LIILSCRPVCICHPISFSGVKTSQLVRSLYDCPAVPVGSEGLSCRVVVATHPADKKKGSVRTQTPSWHAGDTSGMLIL